MIYYYFVVLIEQITENILLHSVVKNPFELRKSIDGLSVLVKCSSVPIDAFKMGLVPMNKYEAIVYINNENNGFMGGE